MLSKRLHDALNAQINAELWSAYLYLSMSMDAENKGLKGVANWFFVQFREEQDHARILMNYINSRDAKVVLKPIEEVRTEWTSPLDMFKDTLEHEKVVTSMINNLAAIAAEDKDFASSNMLVWSFVFGHMHFPRDFREGNLHVINLGCWEQYPSYAVLDASGELTLRRLEAFR